MGHCWKDLAIPLQSLFREFVEIWVSVGLTHTTRIRHMDLCKNVVGKNKLIILPL